MPDTNEKLNKFRQIVLDDAVSERDQLLKKISEERTQRILEAEARIRRITDAKTVARASAITAESGRALSRQLLENKRIIAAHREEMAKEVFSAVREKLLSFTQTADYIEHLKALYKEAFDALGNPYDGVVYLRPVDMHFSKELISLLPGRHIQFREGTFRLGGLIVDCESRLQRADQSYDTALNDLDGHFAELFGLSLADD